MLWLTLIEFPNNNSDEYNIINELFDFEFDEEIGIK